MDDLQIQNLPLNVLHIIASYLPRSQLVVLSSCSSKFHTICKMSLRQNYIDLVPNIGGHIESLQLRMKDLEEQEGVFQREKYLKLAIRHCGLKMILCEAKMIDTIINRYRDSWSYICKNSGDVIDLILFLINKILNTSAPILDMEDMLQLFQLNESFLNRFMLTVEIDLSRGVKALWGIRVMDVMDVSDSAEYEIIASACQGGWRLFSWFEIRCRNLLSAMTASREIGPGSMRSTLALLTSCVRLGNLTSPLAGLWDIEFCHVGGPIKYRSLWQQPPPTWTYQPDNRGYVSRRPGQETFEALSDCGARCRISVRTEPGESPSCIKSLEDIIAASPSANVSGCLPSPMLYDHVSITIFGKDRGGTSFHLTTSAASFDSHIYSVSTSVV